jgi:hypothetical protein
LKPVTLRDAARRVTRRPRIKAEAEHLHEVEVAGKSPETPLIAILEVALFVLPIVAAVIAIAVVAAHYFG